MCVENQAHGNAVRGRLNASFFTVFDGYLDRILRHKKQRIFADLPMSFVELGAGVGANFRYMKPGTSLTAIEPNIHMWPGLRRRAEKHDIKLTILPSNAETIALPDDSVEAVICTLVLCTVSDPEQVLAEARRILRPGGRFVFLEHVAAKPGNWRRLLQRIVRRPWRYLFEGCCTDRETAALIRSAGFRSVELDTFKMRSPFIPVNTQIAGTAIA